MKKSLFVILLACMSAPCWAQIQRTAVFDFSQPLSLTPSITPPEGNSNEVPVTDNVFSNGDITIDFEWGNQGLGTSILNFTNPYTHEVTYYLKVSQQALMKVHAPVIGRLDRVSFSDDSSVGDLRVTDDELGSQEDGYKTWINDKKQDIHDLIYKNSFSNAQLKKITVLYTMPSTILIATGDLENGSVLEYFENMHLTFDRNMLVKDASKITLSDGTSSETLSATVKDNVVTLSAASQIAKNGTYTLTVPAKSFVDKEGFENKEMKFSFVIKAPFSPVSITPAAGTVETLPLTIAVDFGEKVGYVDEAASVKLLKDGNYFLTAKAVKASDTKVNFEIQGAAGAISKKGTYKLIVPANVVCNDKKGDAEWERYNKAFDVEYVVVGSAAYLKAQELLQNKSVGYPKVTSAAYVALDNVVKNEASTDAEFKAAIDAYYNETDVLLPENKKWYKIASVNKDGKSLYLAVKEKQVLLVDNIDEASAFEALDHSGVFTLGDADDNMLNVNGVTADAGAEASKLRIAKLDGSAVQLESGDVFDADKALGTFSFKGSYPSVTGNSSVAYALCNHADKKYQTEADVAALYWQSSLTSAFAFVEVEKPAAAIKTVETAYKLTPAIVGSNADLLTLSFDGLTHVTVMSDADAYIANEKGERVKDVTFTPVTGKDNQFTFALTDLAKASYQLVIPEGTFHYEKNNKEVKTQAIKESFTIGKGGSPEDPNLKSDYSIYQMLPDISGFVKDVALNGFMIKNIGYFDGLVANPDREVRLAVYDNNKTIRTGHFESYVDPEDPITPTLLLVFDTPIREGELKADLYAIVILQGTFGDTNFGKFLEDKTTTQASDCHTNPRMTIAIKVDNDKATGIEHVVNSTEKNNVIYDVQGRKVKQMNRSGIYIVNGKKFVKK
jgi:hypothetical protein